MSLAHRIPETKIWKSEHRRAAAAGVSTVYTATRFKGQYYFATLSLHLPPESIEAVLFKWHAESEFDGEKRDLEFERAQKAMIGQ